MRVEKAEVVSPATIANFGPGFDIFGLCLESPFDKVTIRRRADGEASIKAIGKFEIPTSVGENTASHAAMSLAELCGHAGQGFAMTVRKGMKPGSGIGSSAASSVGGALAMATILGVKDKGKILEAAATGEELISGARHYDNVAAALYGGFTAVVGDDRKEVLTVTPPRFKVVVLVPDVTVRTLDARAALPKKVPLSDAVRNLSLCSGMVDAMIKRDAEAVGRFMEDYLSVPYRKGLVPGYDAVRKSGLDAGALGVSLAGSGPAIFAIALKDAPGIKLAMARTLKQKTGLGHTSFITQPGRGARVQTVSRR